MIKYAQSDIKDGLNLIRVGIGNILASLLKGEENNYETVIDYLTTHQAIKHLFPNAFFRYDDNILYVEIDDNIIQIVFEPDKTIFSLV